MTGPAFDAQRFGSIEEQEGWFATLAKTVAVDFDGVLHPYTEGWVGAKPADEPPMPGAEQFLGALRMRGYRVVVFSTRCETQPGLDGTRDWLERWHLAQFVEDVTCSKPAAVAYVDDRAVQFSRSTDEPNWNTCLREVERLTASQPHGSAHMVDDLPVPTQQEALDFLRIHFPLTCDVQGRINKVIEEAGEVMGAWVKMGDGTGRKTLADLAQESAQLMICLLALAEVAGFDLRHETAAEWQRAHEREWPTGPVDPLTVVPEGSTT